ncbi:hypothetical protein ABDM08_004879 [Salmonella enterica]|nr:hypothetical protein [Salmonella enterica]EJQ9383941.1 hypothetical protein [Salmonella enterica]
MYVMTGQQTETGFQQVESRIKGMGAKALDIFCQPCFSGIEPEKQGKNRHAALAACASEAKEEKPE